MALLQTKKSVLLNLKLQHDVKFFVVVTNSCDFDTVGCDQIDLKAHTATNKVCCAEFDVPFSLKKITNVEVEDIKTIAVEHHACIDTLKTRKEKIREKILTIQKSNEITVDRKHPGVEKLRMVYQNVHGITSKKREIGAMLHAFNIDVFACVETFCELKQCMPRYPGYNCWSKVRAGARARGGVQEAIGKIECDKLKHEKEPVEIRVLRGKLRELKAAERKARTNGTSHEKIGQLRHSIWSIKKSIKEEKSLENQIELEKFADSLTKKRDKSLLNLWNYVKKFKNLHLRNFH